MTAQPLPVWPPADWGPHEHLVQRRATGACSWCRSTVLWVITPGREVIAIDPAPHREGDILRSGVVDCTVLHDPADRPVGRLTWRRHFPVCPNRPARRGQLAPVDLQPRCSGCAGVLPAGIEVSHPSCSTRPARRGEAW